MEIFEEEHELVMSEIALIFSLSILYYTMIIFETASL